MRIIPSPFFSAALYRRMSCFVALPDGYESSEERRYPVVYMLHGLYGSESDWIRKGNIADTVERLAAAGDWRDAIVVMPSDGGYGHGTFYINWYDGTGNFGDYFVEDLVAHIDGEFRTVADRSRRAIGGLSMGGFGAVFLALRHPDLFGCAASISGALGSAHALPVRDFIRQEPFARMFGPQKGAYAREIDLHALAQRRLAEGMAPALYMNCGTDDSLLPHNREFRAHLERIGYPHVYEEFDGAHNWDYFGEHAVEALQFVGRYWGNGPEGDGD